MIFEMLNPGLGLVLNVYKLIFTGFHNLLSTCSQKQLTLSGCFLLNRLPSCQICVPHQEAVCHSHLYISDIFVPACYLTHVSVNEYCPSKIQIFFVCTSHYAVRLNSDYKLIELHVIVMFWREN